MIKFFRKIRQNLLTENKFSKYLLYAIGEIVLVVIGILIALQINSWNQNQNDRDIERDYLLNLKEDLMFDTTWTKGYVLNRYEAKIQSLEKGKNFYQGKYIIEDTISFLNIISYGGVFGNASWGFKIDSYNELINTGSFRKIASKKLRSQIAEYYSKLDEQSENIKRYQSNYASFMNSLKPFNRADRLRLDEYDRELMLKYLKTEEFYRLCNEELTFAHYINTIF